MSLDASSTAKALTHAEGLKTRFAELIDPILTEGRKGGKCKLTAMQLANIVLLLRTVVDKYQEAQTYLDKAYDELTKEIVPNAFEREETTTLTLKAGYRITISNRYLASIIPEQKAQAYEWLRKNNMGDLIQETVNASTLSRAGRELIEEKGKELPEKLFSCYFQPNTSITKTTKSAGTAGSQKSTSKAK